MTQPTHRQERDRWSILTRALFAWCVVACLLMTPNASRATSDELTLEDKKLLAQGELVKKEKNEQRGTYKLFGGQSWQIVDVPVETAWKVIQDVAGYKNFIPLATESAVSNQVGKDADVAMRQQWGPIDVRYVLQTTLQPEKGALVFRVDHSQPHDIRAGWGFIRVRPFKEGRTLVSFGALVDIGDGVFVSIARPAVRRDLLRIPYFLKNHLEGDQVAATTTP